MCVSLCGCPLAGVYARMYLGVPLHVCEAVYAQRHAQNHSVSLES